MACGYYFPRSDRGSKVVFIVFILSVTLAQVFNITLKSDADSKGIFLKKCVVSTTGIKFSTCMPSVSYLRASITHRNILT